MLTWGEGLERRRATGVLEGSAREAERLWPGAGQRNSNRGPTPGCSGGDRARGALCAEGRDINAAGGSIPPRSGRCQALEEHGGHVEIAEQVCEMWPSELLLLKWRQVFVILVRHKPSVWGSVTPLPIYI